MIRRAAGCETTPAYDSAPNDLAPSPTRTSCSCAARRRARFEVLYERHSGAAFSLAYRMVGTRKRPRTWCRRRSCRSGAPARATTARAARSAPGCSASSTTARSTRCAAPPSTTAAARATRGSRSGSRRASAPTSRSPAARRRETSATALDTLPAEQSHVIELAYFGGFTHSEIADMLETPIGTVKGRMRLGLEKMRDQSRRRGGRAVNPTRRTTTGPTRPPPTCSARSPTTRSRASSSICETCAVCRRRSPSCASPPTRCRRRRRP